MSPEFAISLLKRKEKKNIVFSKLRASLREERQYISQLGDFDVFYEKVDSLIDKAEKSDIWTYEYLMEAQSILDELP